MYIFIFIFIILLTILFFPILLKVNINNLNNNNKTYIIVEFYFLKILKIYSYKRSIENFDNLKNTESLTISQIVEEKNQIENYIKDKIEKYSLNKFSSLLKKTILITLLTINVEEGTGEIYSTIYSVPAIYTILYIYVTKLNEFLLNTKINFSVTPNFNSSTLKVIFKVNIWIKPYYAIWLRFKILLNKNIKTSTN